MQTAFGDPGNTRQVVSKIPALTQSQRDRTLLPPDINYAPGPEYAAEKLGFAMSEGLERSKNGRLWVFWIAGGDSEMAYGLLAYSDNDGKTWTHPVMAIHPAQEPNVPPYRILVGNLWTDPQGRLWLFFDYAAGYFDGRAGLWSMVCQNPDSNSPTWSQPKRIWHGAALNKPVVLSSGEWLINVSLWDYSKIWPYIKDRKKLPQGFREMYKELDEYRRLNIFSSVDQGKSWQLKGYAKFEDPDFDESMIVERKDGSLWMLARTGKGLYETSSTDQGKTWTAPVPAAGILNTNSRHFLRRLYSGNLLLIKHGRQIDYYVDGTTEFKRYKGRSHLTAFISTDDGKTWKGGLCLDDRSLVTYPDGIQAPDGMIYICYDRDRFAECEILLARFTESDVLQGKIVAEGSRLKQVIIKSLGNSTEAVAPSKEK
jgi:hypothetical protein